MSVISSRRQGARHLEMVQQIQFLEHDQTEMYCPMDMANLSVLLSQMQLSVGIFSRPFYFLYGSKLKDLLFIFRIFRKFRGHLNKNPVLEFLLLFKHICTATFINCLWFKFCSS